MSRRAWNKPPGAPSLQQTRVLAVWVLYGGELQHVVRDDAEREVVVTQHAESATGSVFEVRDDGLHIVSRVVHRTVGIGLGPFPALEVAARMGLQVEASWHRVSP